MKKALLVAFCLVVSIPDLYSADTDIIINEVMSNPNGNSSDIPGDKSNEFIELYNKGTTAINVAGWSIAGKAAVSKLEGWNVNIATHGPLTNPNVSGSTGSTVIPAGGFAVILRNFYNDSNNNQPYNFPAGTVILRSVDGALKGNGSAGDLSTTEPLMLFNAACSSVSTFGTPNAPTPAVCAVISDLDDGFPTDPGADTSWERVDPNGADSSTNWKKSTKTQGTPGAVNSVFGVGCPAGSGIVKGLITEVAPSLSATAGGDFIEIFITESSNLCGAKLFEGSTLLKTFPSVTPKSGAFGLFIIFHAGTKLSDTPDETDATGDTNLNGAIDLSSDESSPGISGTSDNTITLQNLDGTIADFMSFADNDNVFSTTLQTTYDTAVSTAKWSPACAGDQVCYTNGSVPWANKATLSMARRVANNGLPQDSKPSVAGDWLVGTPTPGRGYGSAIQPKGEILEIFQSPFSPFGDGRFTEAVFGYKVPKATNVTIQVFDLQGRLVRTVLDNNTSGSSESQVVVWDGRDADAQIVPMGIYVVHIEAQKPDGVVDKDSKTVIVGRRL